MSGRCRTFSLGHIPTDIPLGHIPPGHSPSLLQDVVQFPRTR